ncbi:hypothetical protein MUA04_01005 [Enterobacteriaceae bacterium H11S18]|uniref:hypothetical protein n=1 Tax=Dryocola clanedunensis TaxID=2925396 RepID=UPI0022F021F0|nr:hypothetical protein [Dryocola clanedunensis]MCT4708814.1 hypothetical protein [Dryocola clanedunensis]
MPKISIGHPITKALTEDIYMNAKQRRILRYRAKCAAQKIDAKNYAGKINRAFAKLSGEGSERTCKAMSLPGLRQPKEEEFVTRESQQYRKVRNPLGQQVNARQKVHGKSISLI